MYVFAVLWRTEDLDVRSQVHLFHPESMTDFDLQHIIGAERSDEENEINNQSVLARF
jgi:hypothetical protein